MHWIDFAPLLHKGDNFCDFLCVFLAHDAPSEKGSTLKEARICSPFQKGSEQLAAP